MARAGARTARCARRSPPRPRRARPWYLRRQCPSRLRSCARVPSAIRTMRIIPVIDLRAGEAVHGVGGNRARYEPVDIGDHADARRRAGAGARVCRGAADERDVRRGSRCDRRRARAVRHAPAALSHLSKLDRCGSADGGRCVLVDRCRRGSRDRGARDDVRASRVFKESCGDSGPIAWCSVSICGTVCRLRPRTRFAR